MVFLPDMHILDLNMYPQLAIYLGLDSPSIKGEEEMSNCTQSSSTVMVLMSFINITQLEDISTCRALQQYGPCHPTLCTCANETSLRHDMEWWDHHHLNLYQGCHHEIFYRMVFHSLFKKNPVIQSPVKSSFIRFYYI